MQLYRCSHLWLWTWAVLDITGVGQGTVWNASSSGVELQKCTIIIAVDCLIYLLIYHYYEYKYFPGKYISFLRKMGVEWASNEFHDHTQRLTLQIVLSPNIWKVESGDLKILSINKHPNVTTENKVLTNLWKQKNNVNTIFVEGYCLRLASFLWFKSFISNEVTSICVHVYALWLSKKNWEHFISYNA